MKLRKKIGVYILCLIALLMFGCVSSVSQKKSLDTFNNLYYAGNYEKAANVELDKIHDNKTNSSKLLELLQAGSSLRYAQQYKQSSSLFDQCEEIIKKHNEEILATNITSNIGAILVNDAVLDYKGSEYDGIMVNTYKALNFWQEGKKDLARIEFNRALDRQRRAKENFAAEINRLKEDIEKKQEEENKKAQAKSQNAPQMDIAKNVNNPEIEKILKEKYSNLYEFKSYPDFINPFTTYVSGLFFMSDGDYSKATTLLKEAYGMVEENPIVAADFASVENITTKEQKEETKYIWVIFENGLGPEKEEFRVDLPILLLTEKVKYTGIALPKLKLRTQAYSNLAIIDNGNKIGETTILASMDRVIQTEFKKRYTSIVTRAVTSTLIKTFGQYLAQKKFGDLGGFGAAIYQGATTSADIRIWTALPKEFQIAKVINSNRGEIILETPNGIKVNISIPKNENSIIYVKIPSNGAKIVYDVIKM